MLKETKLNFTEVFVKFDRKEERGVHSILVIVNCNYIAQIIGHLQYKLVMDDKF